MDSDGSGDEIYRLKLEVARLSGELAEKDLRLEQLSRTEEALRESQDKYHELFELGREAIFLIDNETGQLLEANTAAVEMYEYSRDELLQLKNTDLSAQPSATRRITTQSPPGGAVVPLRYHRKKSGAVFPVEINGRFFSWKGRDVHVAAIRDITDRQQIEDRIIGLSALKEQLLGTGSLEAKLKQITDCAVTVFGADFARIWILGEGDLCGRGCPHAAVVAGMEACPDRARCLHLLASSGRYERTDGKRCRVPLGASSIGRIVTGKDLKYISNDAPDDAFIDDPAWAHSLGIVSFAGYRLLSGDGNPVGVMALFKKSSLLPEEELLLGDLAGTVSQVIIAGMAEDALRASEVRFRSLIQNSTDIIWILDRNGLIVYESPSSAELLGYPSGYHIGRSPLDLVHPGDLDRVRPDLAEVFEKRNDGKPTELRVRKADGVYLDVESVGTNLIGVPEVDGIVINTRPITDRKQAEEQLRASLQEKEVLLKEVHHRVKNNLQIITSLLHLQSATLQDEASISAFLETESRIRIMAVMHEKLYQSRNLSSIDLGEYTLGLINSIFLSYGIAKDRIRLVTELDRISLGIDVAIPCGLILHELVTNAVKYAFAGDRSGTLTIRQHRQADGQISLVVRDDGQGLPEGLDIAASTTLGLQLVSTLVQQLEGSLEVKNDGGAVFCLCFSDRKR